MGRLLQSEGAENSVLEYACKTSELDSDIFAQAFALDSDRINGQPIAPEKLGKLYEDLVERDALALTDTDGRDILTLSEDGKYYLGDAVRRGVGAKSPTFPDVNNPLTEQPFNFVPGTRPKYPPDHTMAGKGCKTGRQIDDIKRLIRQYNLNEMDAAGWKKEKARYSVYDKYGEIREIEIHWYYHDKAGRVENKVKVNERGQVYVDEW